MTRNRKTRAAWEAVLSEQVSTNFLIVVVRLERLELPNGLEKSWPVSQTPTQ